MLQEEDVIGRYEARVDPHGYKMKIDLPFYNSKHDRIIS